MVNVVYPDVYEQFLSVLNLVNLDLGLILSISCVVNVKFYGRLAFATISPLALLGGLGVTYAAARKRNGHSPAGLLAARGKHLSVALFVIFVVYSSVSFIVFQTFSCETLDDGVKYLRADYSLECTSSGHKAWMAYAGLMIVVCPIGIPAVFAWWLVSNRHDLLKVKIGGGNSSSSDRLKPMRDLWEPYKPRRYYDEVVDCGRRIALTGLGVFLFPGSSQVALEVVFAAVFLVLSEMISPFAAPMDALLYRSGTWVVFFGMCLALLLKFDPSGEDIDSQETFASILIAANVALVLIVLVQAMLSVKRDLFQCATYPSLRKAPAVCQSLRCVTRRLAMMTVNGNREPREFKRPPGSGYQRTRHTALPERVSQFVCASNEILRSTYRMVQ